MITANGANGPFVAAFCLAASLLPSVLCAQIPHAVQVVRFDDRGGAGGGIFIRANFLGAPDGAVCSLGIGGDVVLALGVPIVDGPGADFIVTENPFLSGAPGYAFSEVFFVEVSSDGVHFARFPSSYGGPPTHPGAFGIVHTSWYAGLGGVCPGWSGGDLFDVVEAGGDAFDLADLATHPLVLQNLVHLNAIREIRLVDVQSGIDRDSQDRLIFDPGAGSADVDAITVLHHPGSITASHPRVSLSIPPDGNLTLTLSDPDGLSDLDLTSLRAALYGIPVNALDLLVALVPTHASTTSVTFRLGGPLPPGFGLRLSFSIKDLNGQRSGATAVRPL